MRRGIALLPIVLLLVGAGCASSKAPSGTPAKRPPALTLLVDESGPWREIPVDDEAPRPVAARPAPAVARPVEVVAAPRGPTLQVPERRVTAKPRALGTKPTKSPKDRARERFLDHPTRVKASRITFYCPRRFAREVRLTGDEVTQPKPGRRIAAGAARLTCRELTLEADRIVFRIEDAPDAAVQATARGDASFVTNQRGQVLRHEHVRILVLSDDQVTPLR